MNRRLTHIHDSYPTADGDGVKIYRNIAGGSLSAFDPFLLLDELYSDDPADYIGGFPEHPHRGFETVTYMLEGSMKHKDHMGNEGLLEPGSVQWMTAGRGVLHSEMPLQDEGRLHGFQLWVNLPANEKMRPADYQELPKEKIPVITIGERSYVKVIAGAFNRNGSIVSGPITGVTTAPDYFDIFLGEGDTVDVTTEKKGVAILHGNGTNSLIGAGNTTGNGGDNFQWMDIWSIKDMPESLKDQPVSQGLYVEKSESASGFIYWDGTSFVWLQQGD